MRFVKMQGAGNDFIIINNIEEKLPLEKLPAIAARLCTPHVSIGADGLMAVTESASGADYAMLFFNSDGSMGEMCGNGARCIARYGWEMKLAGETQRIETTAGLVLGQRLDKRRYKIRLNEPSLVDTARKAEALGREYRCCYIELGSPGLPHGVINLPGWQNMDKAELYAIGAALRSSPVFPKGANISFAELSGPGQISAVTFERGVEDFTLACGTGSGCITVAFYLWGLLEDKKARVSMPGGELEVEFSLECGRITELWLSGPTNTVCSGEITDEELQL